jgi:hypothetical protein
MIIENSPLKMITMKKIILLLALLFGFTIHTSIKAQLTDDGSVNFTAILGGAFQLIPVDGFDQTATFSTGDDYNFGVSQTQGTGITPGFTTVAMEATGNWNLQIKAEDFMPNGTGTGSIPISNLGVYCEATGVHQFGVEVTCNYVTIDAALGLTSADVTLIDLASGNTNSGDQTDNTFVLRWLMGTMNGTMNSQSMFEQLSAGLFSQGQYITTVVLTMTEIPQ